jgi:hypothetical protein
MLCFNAFFRGVVAFIAFWNLKQIYIRMASSWLCALSRLFEYRTPS